MLAFVLNRTTYGMNVKAVGENPAAADSLGVSVTRTRYIAVIVGSSLGGLAGATLLFDVGIFQQNLTQSEGFIAVALVYFGAWRAWGVLLGALLYGLTQATVLSWKGLGIIPVSLSDLAAAAPAVITVLALLTIARRFRQPAALGTPYARGGWKGAPKSGASTDPNLHNRKGSIEMRKLLIILAAVVALAVAAVPTATPKSHAPQLKVALIAPSAHNDLAFTQSMYHALQNLQKQFNFQLSLSENQFVVANAANIMHQYAQEGYDLIIAHGSQYGATVQQLAPQFPKTTFAWGTAGETYGLSNVYAYQAASEQGGYVNGFIAAFDEQVACARRHRPDCGWRCEAVCRRVRRRCEGCRARRRLCTSRTPARSVTRVSCRSRRRSSSRRRPTS